MKFKKMFTVVSRKLLGEYRWALKQGLKVGTGFSTMGGGSSSFGAEPYLITIGNNVRLSYNVDFVTHDGGTWAFRREKGREDIVRFGKITVGDDTFIGAHATIMPGVNIGKNCVIGIGSIVTTDIPDRCVAAGIPAKVICSTDEYADKCRKKMPVNWNESEYKKNKKEYLLKIL